MDRVGGYGDYLLLSQDARAHDLVELAVEGEAGARLMAARQQEAWGG